MNIADPMAPPKKKGQDAVDRALTKIEIALRELVEDVRKEAMRDVLEQVHAKKKK